MYVCSYPALVCFTACSSQSAHTCVAVARIRAPTTCIVAHCTHSKHAHTFPTDDEEIDMFEVIDNDDLEMLQVRGGSPDL